MEITYRPAKVDDLEDAERVVQEAFNELRLRHGGRPSPAPPSIAFPQFCLAEDPDGLWVAEHGDTIVGFGFSWMTGSLWCLSQLFVRPQMQAKGIGQALLSKTLMQAERNGAANRVIVTFAYNVASTGLYLNNGHYPREPLFRMAAPAQAVAQNLADAGMRRRRSRPGPSLTSGSAGSIGSCSASVEICITDFCSAAAQRAQFASSERARSPATPTSPPRAASARWQSHRTPMPRRS